MVTISIARFIDLDRYALHDILRLRTDVFVVEQECAYPELDGRDTAPATWHLWATEDDAVVAYLRVTRDGDDHRIGRVCTAAASRGRGLAARLMTAALEHIGETRVWMHAQAAVAPFYERFGFVVDGERFDEDGIPHVLMTRNVPTSAARSR